MAENNFKQQLELAQSLANQSDFNGAIATFESVLAEQSDQIDAIMGLGNCCLQIGDIEKAFKQYEKGRELRPSAVDFAYQYAHCLFLGGYQKESLTELQRATGLCGDDPFFCTEIARLLVKLGEAQGALGLLDRLKQLTVDDQLIMSQALGLQNRWAESVQLLHRLRTELPSEAFLAGELSLAAAHNRDYRLAIANFEEYLKLSTPKANDYLRFADLLVLGGELQRARHALEQCKDESQDNKFVADWHFLSSRLSRAQHDSNSAQESCEASLKLSPANGQAWSALVEFCDDFRLEEHKNQLSDLIEKQAFSSSYQLELAEKAFARCCARLGEIESATSALKEANQRAAADLDRRKARYSKQTYKREVNSIIEQFPRALFDLPGAKPTAVEGTPIFIVGVPRSGSSLIEQLLVQDKSIQRGGEQEAVNLVINEYWRQNSMANIPLPKDLTQEQWSHLAGACIGRYTCRVNSMYTNSLASNFQHVGFILKMFPQGRIIQLHRNPKDCAISLYQTAFSNRYSYACNIADALDFHECSERLMSHWNQLNTNQIINIDYESFFEKPEYYGKQVFEFCGLRWKDEYLKSISEPDSSSDDQKFTIASINKWRKYDSLLADELAV